MKDMIIGGSDRDLSERRFSLDRCVYRSDLLLELILGSLSSSRIANERVSEKKTVLQKLYAPFNNHDT